MCNAKILKEILSVTTDRFRNIFSDSLKYVILYGSYARGDYDEESDIDIVALVDMERMELKKYFKDVVKLSSDIDLEYGVMLSPSVLPFNEYEKYKDDLPYYSNIQSEGIVINAFRK